MSDEGKRREEELKKKDEEELARLFERFQHSLGVSPLDGPYSLTLQAGYSVIPDFGVAKIDAVELLLRATTALRELQVTGSPERIRLFQPETAPAL